MAKCNPNEVLFQRRCSNSVYVTPDGLQELMTDISREVLRCQPENICEFIANYLDALLITRENAKVACRIVSNLTDSSFTIAQLLNRLEISPEVAKKAATIIQRAFRKHYLLYVPSDTSCASEDFDTWALTQKLLRRNCIDVGQATDAARVIQRAYRGYRAHVETRNPCDKVDWRDASRRTIGILKTTDTPDWERKRAATLIKAAYKGYYTRTQVRRMFQRKQGKEEKDGLSFTEEDFIHNTPTLEENDFQIMAMIHSEAAIMIQRCFRAYKKRKSEILTSAIQQLEVQNVESMNNKLYFV